MSNQIVIKITGKLKDDIEALCAPGYKEPAQWCRDAIIAAVTASTTALPAAQTQQAAPKRQNLKPMTSEELDAIALELYVVANQRLKDGLSVSDDALRTATDFAHKKGLPAPSGKPESRLERYVRLREQWKDGAVLSHADHTFVDKWNSAQSDWLESMFDPSEAFK